MVRDIGGESAEHRAVNEPRCAAATIRSMSASTAYWQAALGGQPSRRCGVASGTSATRFPSQ